MYINMNTSTYICIHTSNHIYIYLHAYIYILFVFIRIYVYTYTYLYTCVDFNIYIYVHMCCLQHVVTNYTYFVCCMIDLFITAGGPIFDGLVRAGLLDRNSSVGGADLRNRERKLIFEKMCPKVVTSVRR